jgi:hypothetical protein
MNAKTLLFAAIKTTGMAAMAGPQGGGMMGGGMMGKEGQGGMTGKEGLAGTGMSPEMMPHR